MTVVLLEVVIGIHVAAGLTAVVSGAAAMLTRKGPGRHPYRGTIYLGALVVVGVTAAGIAIARPHTAYLLIVGAVALTAAAIGYSARRMRRRGWLWYHMIGMPISYIAMLTAFYVDNGPRLPLWSLLPPLTFWFLPSAVGLPLLARALRRAARRAVDAEPLPRLVGGRCGEDPGAVSPGPARSAF